MDEYKKNFLEVWQRLESRPKSYVRPIAAQFGQYEEWSKNSIATNRDNQDLRIYALTYKLSLSLTVRICYSSFARPARLIQGNECVVCLWIAGIFNVWLLMIFYVQAIMTPGTSDYRSKAAGHGAPYTEENFYSVIELESKNLLFSYWVSTKSANAYCQLYISWVVYIMWYM